MAQFLVFKEKTSFLPEIILPSRDAKKTPTKSIKEIWALKSCFLFVFFLSPLPSAFSNYQIATNAVGVSGQELHLSSVWSNTVL